MSTNILSQYMHPYITQHTHQYINHLQKQHSISLTLKANLLHVQNVVYYPMLANSYVIYQPGVETPAVDHYVVVAVGSCFSIGGSNCKDQQGYSNISKKKELNLL